MNTHCNVTCKDVIFTEMANSFDGPLHCLRQMDRSAHLGRNHSFNGVDLVTILDVFYQAWLCSQHIEYIVHASTYLLACFVLVVLAAEHSDDVRGKLVRIS